MKTVLVLTDFSEKAEQAAIYAFHIASATNASVLLYHFFVIPQIYPSEAGIYSYHEDRNEKNDEIDTALDKLSNRLKDEFSQDFQQAPPPVRYSSEAGPMNGKLERLIDTENISMIVMGDQSEEVALNRILFGNESHTVIEESTCPVMLIPEDSEYRAFQKILFAAELNSSESDALKFLESLAGIWEAKIKLLHITDRDLNTHVLREYKHNFEELISGTSYSHISHDVVYGTDVTETLSSYIDDEVADMIVLVHKKRSKIGQFMHRSISKTMMNYHQAPLLILQK